MSAEEYKQRKQIRELNLCEKAKLAATCAALQRQIEMVKYSTEEDIKKEVSDITFDLSRKYAKPAWVERFR
jgi:hypothetical protein